MSEPKLEGPLGRVGMGIELIAIMALARRAFS